jgi:hypothetical protein
MSAAMHLDFHQIDAFTYRPFSGNPAVVYRLDAWLLDSLMPYWAERLVGASCGPTSVRRVVVSCTVDWRTSE